MATATVRLEPENIAASVQSLRAELTKAQISGVKTVTKKDAVYLEMPIAGISGYQFSSSNERCSWQTSKKKVIVQSKGFAVEQQIDKKALHVVFRLVGSESKKTIPKKTGTIRQVFFQRSLRAIEELRSLNEQKLAEAVQAPTDYSVLLCALNTEEALASIRGHDPLAGARLRGLEAKRRLVESEGGALSTAQVSKAFGITRQAVDKRRKERRLLGVELGKKGFRYPAWQIGLPHLEDVLKALGARDSWEQIAFFLNPSALLRDRTPLEVLREDVIDISDVLIAASSYGEQGA